jgi:TusA-related sulfurtransferase
MLDIQKSQLQKCMITLNMLKCEYKIRTSDGELFGTLDLSVKPTVVDEKVRRKRGPPRDYSRLQIPEKLACMQVGDVLVLQADEEFTVADIQSHVSSKGIHLFGTNNFVTMRNHMKKCVECMRTG